MELERKWAELGIDCLVNIFEKLCLDDIIFIIPLVCKSWCQASADPRCWRVIDLTGAQAFLTASASYRLLSFLLHRSRGSVVKLVYPDGYMPIQNVIFLSTGWPTLKELSLPRIYRDEHSYISDLVSKWRCLERLYIPRKQSYFKELLMCLQIYCKNLRCLQTRGKFTIEDAVSIAKYLVNLKHLNLSRSRISKEAIMVITGGCRELEELNVEDCWGLVVDEEVINSVSGGTVIKTSPGLPEMMDISSDSEADWGFWQCDSSSDEDSIS